MDNDAALRNFLRQVSALETILQESKGAYRGSNTRARVEAWLPNVERSLKELGLVQELNALRELNSTLRRNMSIGYADEAHAFLDFSREIVARLDDERQSLPSIDDSGLPRFPITDAAKQVLWICRRFQRFATQLAKRQRGRTTLLIRDEYDVQDAFHALLRMHFPDVRPEEQAPSHAGCASRLDFLLKAERIVVEIKHTRDGLLDAALADELILDINRYAAHPDCGHLICFIYDPEHRLRNPGLQRDLSRSHEKMLVWVVVEPT